MITATLVVSRPFDLDGDGELREEDWGGIGLSSAPSTGDLIYVLHDSECQIVRVDRVIHHAIVWPPPDDELSEIRRKEAYLEIMAEWVTIDLTSYKTG